MKHATPVRLTFSILIISLLLSSPAAALTVTSTADSGPGSLREAIANTNLQFATEIKFSLPPGSTITLTSGPLKITSKVIITGPGANLLTIQRSTAAGTPKFRVFHTAPHNGPVTISGLTIANGDASAVLEFGGGILNEGELTLSGVTVSGNTASGGGGIWNERGSLTLDKSTISGNSAGGGGGISGGKVKIMSSTISGNSARDGNGGGIAVSIATLVDSTVTGNSATGSGGGIFNNAGDGTNLRVKNCIVALNTAATGPDVSGAMMSESFNIIGNPSGADISGGLPDQIGVSAAALNLGPLQDNGGPTKTHALLTGSVAIDRGNSTAVSDQRGSIRTVDSPTLANAAHFSNGTDVGAYEVQADALSGCVSLVENLNATGPGSLHEVIEKACAGSTISFASNVRGTISLTLRDLFIEKVLTINGPGAHLLTVERSASATREFRVITIAPFESDLGVTISGLTISNGRADDFGGGIAVTSKATINQCIISGNSAAKGGGIYVSAPLTLTDSTVTGNSTPNEGGAIFSRSVLVRINRSTLSANRANQGGAICSLSQPEESTVTITNSTISSNSAADGGGGIFAVANGPSIIVLIANSTIAGNSATDAGGGILRTGNTGVFLRNTLVALNTAGVGPDILGDVASQGFNIIGNGPATTLTPSTSSDRVGVPVEELKLGPLQDNGGPASTHALLPGSVAIDAGHSSGASTDQRGAPRPIDRPEIANAGDGADVGAFEVQPPGPTPTPAPSAKLGNIATRVRVETGENVLIGGMIITGSQPKRLIVRAIGPSLDVTGALSNPQLEIYRGDELIAANDNWREASNQQEIFDSTVAPSSELESAILTTLAPGVYTAVVSGVGGETGVGSVEAYDLDLTADSRFGNISTRGRVLTDANVMIGGVIVTGSSAQKVIVRAIGPSLGIAAQLEDPLLELYDTEGNLLTANDNWRDTQQAEIEATTIPPTNERESAIVATLPPAAYTAIVRGVNDTTGVALVEVYALD